MDHLKTNKYGSVTAQDINKVYVKGVPSTLKRDQSLAALASTVAIDTTYGTANYTLGNITWQKNSSNTSDTTVSGGTYTMIINVKPNAGFKFASGFAYTDVTTDGANATSGAAAVAADGSYNVSIQFSTIAPNDAEKLAAAIAALQSSGKSGADADNAIVLASKSLTTVASDTDIADLPTLSSEASLSVKNLSVDATKTTAQQAAGTPYATGDLKITSNKVQVTSGKTCAADGNIVFSVDVTVGSEPAQTLWFAILVTA